MTSRFTNAAQAESQNAFLWRMYRELRELLSEFVEDTQQATTLLDVGSHVTELIAQYVVLGKENNLFREKLALAEADRVRLELEVTAHQERLTKEVTAFEQERKRFEEAQQAAQEEKALWERSLESLRREVKHGQALLAETEKSLSHAREEQNRLSTAGLKAVDHALTAKQRAGEILRLLEQNGQRELLAWGNTPQFDHETWGQVYATLCTMVEASVDLSPEEPAQSTKKRKVGK